MNNFIIGQEISWLEYNGLDTPPTELRGTVTKIDENIATCEEHRTGKPYEVRELSDGVFVSVSRNAPLTPPITIDEPKENTGPLTFTGESIQTGKESAPAPAAARKPDPGISVGVLYYGPAYQHAVDMLAEMFGKALAGVGHVKGDDSEQDAPTTMYCFFVEAENQINDLEHILKHHKNARHFEPVMLSPVPDEEIDQARATVAAGELPLLTRL
jgi:hypothetical protein